MTSRLPLPLERRITMARMLREWMRSLGWEFLLSQYVSHISSYLEPPDTMSPDAFEINACLGDVLRSKSSGELIHWCTKNGLNGWAEYKVDDMFDDDPFEGYRPLELLAPKTGVVLAALELTLRREGMPRANARQMVGSLMRADLAVGHP